MCDLCRADGNYFHTPECVYDQLASEYPVMWLRDSTRIGACYTLRELLSPEGMVLATAFSTMRKYGMNILTATRHMDINAYVKSDPRMPGTRLRRYLGQYGLRGDALSREVRRIVAGPERRDSTPQEGIYYTWPYGWEPADFTPMMRRIFKGKRTRHVVLSDELPQLFGKSG